MATVTFTATASIIAPLFRSLLLARLQESGAATPHSLEFVVNDSSDSFWMPNIHFFIDYEMPVSLAWLYSFVLDSVHETVSRFSCLHRSDLGDITILSARDNRVRVGFVLSIS